MPTPCTEWNVLDLVNHMIGAVHLMASAVAAEAPPAGDPPDFTASHDPAKEFLVAADLSLALWRSDGALGGSVQLGPVEIPGPVALGINQIDMLSHAWDVCEALGDDRSIDPTLDETAFLAEGRVRWLIRCGGGSAILKLSHSSSVTTVPPTTVA